MTDWTTKTSLPVSARAAFDWHARPGAFERLSPPWDHVRLVRSGPMANGAQVEIRVPVGPFRKRWLAQYEDVEPGRGFTDVQVAGPFAEWRHRHRFHHQTERRSELEDHIQFRMPLGALGAVGRPWLRRSLRALFRWRHAVTFRDLSFLNSEISPMKILITGSSGLVGSALVPFLTTQGHSVVRAVREHNSSPGTVRWSTESGLDTTAAELEGLDAVIHLAGEGIASRRWTPQQMERIRNSRVEGTLALCTDLAKLKAPPRTLICASAIGFYGDRGDDVLTEESSPGTGFLPEVAQAWESACNPARAAGIRVVHTRFGVILDPKGGALKKMLPAFRMGAGGRLGNGRQFMSWVSREDVIRILLFALENKEISGPVNVVAPNPVSNRTFTKALGEALGRPTIFPLPAFMARLVFGKMAEPLLLASARVLPTRLQEAHYEFVHDDIGTCLKELLGKA